MHVSRITSHQASPAEPAGLPGRTLRRSQPGVQLHVGVNGLGIPDIGTQLTFGKRAIVCHHGDPATHLFWVEQGAVMVQHYLQDGRRQLVGIVLPGGICGFSQQNLYSATCETLRPSVLRACRRSELERHGELGWVVAHQVERQLCAAQAHALALGRMTAQERLCALLSRFAAYRPTSRFERPSDGLNVHIQLPMTRGEIGDYLGLSLETVCRTLTDLQRKGILEIGRHHGDVVIQSVKRLNRLGGASQ
jgi:CRP/FNR family transcriptional regulator, nitrogen fixation regulation protein